VAQHIQSIVLPQEAEYQSFEDLDIACTMLPATEVGGDFYDTIKLEDGGIVTIGDVTDHGLHSGLIMMMVHTALRAASKLETEDVERLFSVVNDVLYEFRTKTADHRIMSLLILRYLGNGGFTATGQHESLILIRRNAEVERIDSVDLGMYAGLETDVTPYLKTLNLSLDSGDVMLLYTDGVTEAMNESSATFGTEGIVNAALRFRAAPAERILNAVVDSCRAHIGNARYYDDISLMVIKKK